MKADIGKMIVHPIIELSLKELLLVKGIMLAFRIPDKQPSKTPSFYVAKILQPLRKFIDTEFKSSSEESKLFFAKLVISEVTTKYFSFFLFFFFLVILFLNSFNFFRFHRYREWAVEVLQSAQQQRIILLKLKAKESDPKFKPGDVGELSLDEKIAIQLDSDIIGFGKEIQYFGISPVDFDLYHKLVNYKTELPPQ